MPKPIKVLFIHGLESKPNGAKVRGLRKQGFDVRCDDMYMSLFRLHRPNAIMRNVLRLPIVRLWALSLALIPIVGWLVNWFWVALALNAFVLILGLIQKERVFARACMMSLEACISIQQRALEAYKPDIIIGSSWGGAVTGELMRRGLWTGPTILLAPAYQKVMLISNVPNLNDRLQTLRQLSRTQHFAIFHDPTDNTVPYVHSQTLAMNTSITLHTVDAGGHRLLGIIEDGSLVAAIQQACPV